MLTKDHLKHSFRNGAVYPHYLKPQAEEVQERARQILDFFTQSVGKKQRVVAQECQLKSLDETAQDRALLHLVESQCEYQEPSEQLVDQRWELFELSRKLRMESDFETPEDFHLSLEAQCGHPIDELMENLYGDLPESRRLAKAHDFDPESLVHRYNLAQIQGLLLRAQKMKLTLEFKNTAQQRALFQKIRFHRLLIEPTKTQGKSIEIELSGPMSVFEQTTTYGSRFANFFPHVVDLPKWSLEAEIKLSGKIHKLQLDSGKNKLKSHYKSLQGYVPEEFQSFIDLFNKMGQGSKKKVDYSCKAASQFLHLGEKNNCFPDFVFESEKGETSYLELFHRWHASQLKHRLQVIDNVIEENLLIGVCQNIKLDEELKSLMKQAESAGVKLFRFRSFPSPRTVLAALRG